MEARAVLTKYGTALLPLFSEIDFVLKVSGRMVHELRKELEKDFKQENI